MLHQLADSHVITDYSAFRMQTSFRSLDRSLFRADMSALGALIGGPYCGNLPKQTKNTINHFFGALIRAQSVTWNPHKLMGALLQCSTIHFKEDGLLMSCNQMSADYLFMQDKLYDIKYDTGDKVIQCGRHNDIFKLWLQWRAKGDDGFEKHMDRLMELAEYMVKRIKQMPDKFYLIMEPELVNVSFWYIPTRLRKVAHTPAREQELGKLCPILKARMMQSGTLMVGYQPDDRRPNFFRSIISSAALTEADIDFKLAEMDKLGHDL